MYSVSIWHWLLLIFWIVLIAVPVARLLKRTGHSGWWTILTFVPFANLVGLWVWAYSRWPTDRADTAG